MNTHRFFLYFLSSFFIVSCKKDIVDPVCKEYPYKARLAIKGICFNYVIEFIDVDPNSNLVESEWTDTTTGKVYNNVFRLSNYCDFPPEIKEGNEFFFSIDLDIVQDSCLVCQAFRPTPAKFINISVCESPN